MFSFGQFPGVTILIADVSEPSISSSFIGRWMKSFIHLPMKMELIEGSETSAISIVTPENYPKKTYYKNICIFFYLVDFNRAPVRYVTKTCSVVLLNKKKHILLSEVYCV